MNDTARSIGAAVSNMRARDISVIQVLCAVSLLCLVQRVSAQATLPGGDCTTSDDCYGEHPCVGGKCCSFTETQHSSSEGLFSACSACGGAVGYYTMDWSSHAEPDAYESGTEGVDYRRLEVAGACISCDDGLPDPYTRLSYDELVDGEFVWDVYGATDDDERRYLEGVCAKDTCSSSQYLYINWEEGAESNVFSCVSKRAAGASCTPAGYDAEGLTWVDEEWKCLSGLCGHEHCCASSTCESGLCDETGVCVSKTLPGGDCTTSDDCYGEHPCVGGKCCSFTETQHSSSEGLFSACSACGGAVGYYTMDWSSHAEPDAYESGTEGVDYRRLEVAGACISCDDGLPDPYTRLSYDELVDGEFVWDVYGATDDDERRYLEGVCAKDTCSSSQYLYINWEEGAESNVFSCVSKRAAGASCTPAGYDAEGLTWVDEEWKCLSGLCGHEHCCASSTCESGLCDDTGACLSNSNSGDAATSPSTSPPEDASVPSPSEGSDTYPGTAGCELVCEAPNLTQLECGLHRYCEWDSNRCWSSVGSQPCPCTAAADCPEGECVDTQCVPAPESESEPASGSASDERVAASIDALVDTISDPDDKRKAKLLAVAVAAGATVPRLKMTRNAASEDAACEDAFAKMQVSPDVGICEVLRTHVRRLLAGNLNYDLSVLLDPTEVDETELQVALSNLQTAGVSATNDRVEPAVELAEIPGMDADALASFEAAVEEAAAEEEEEESAAEASPPPPPPQPPRVLVADDESGAERRRLGMIVAVMGAMAAIEGVAAAMG